MSKKTLQYDHQPSRKPGQELTQKVKATQSFKPMNQLKLLWPNVSSIMTRFAGHLPRDFCVPGERRSLLEQAIIMLRKDIFLLLQNGEHAGSTPVETRAIYKTAVDTLSASLLRASLVELTAGKAVWAFDHEPFYTWARDHTGPSVATINGPVPWNTPTADERERMHRILLNATDQRIYDISKTVLVEAQEAKAAIMAPAEYGADLLSEIAHSARMPDDVAAKLVGAGA